ncbi:MAG: HXXEE domain-containing protein [Mesorhizobium sp.]|nr:HXXEE domain-containing protein [Mesorhizobium sp.]
MAPATAAVILAFAVTLHNIEEMIWLPGFRHPALPVLTPFQFRFAATAVAVLFWLLAAGLAAGVPLAPVLTGFAAAMIVNALVPHLALTLVLRRYHPGLATGLLAVVPAAFLALSSLGGAVAIAESGVLAWRAGAAFVALGFSVPLLLWSGSKLERWRGT